MPKTLKRIAPSVLIVDNKCGNLFIVEGKKSGPQIQNKPKIKHEKINEILIHQPQQSSIEFANNNEDQECPDTVEDVEYDEDVVEEYLDECFEEDAEQDSEEINNMKIEDQPMLDHQYVVAKNEEHPSSEVFIRYSSDDFDERSDEFPLSESHQTSYDQNLSKKKHKIRQLTGKPACKYCDTIFLTKESRDQHNCEFLQCDPKNFICRICNKELSRKTFSNHLHETLACQYCGRNFINPRNLKTHIKKLHSNEKFIPPKSPDPELFKDVGTRDEVNETLVLDEETGNLMQCYLAKPPKKKYPVKKGRFECDLCGRIFTTLRSLKTHVDIHSNNFRYVCPTCGSKYATHTGFSKHACLKKRKRPVVDFRIYDVRHCKYCGESFNSYEENKSHPCEYLMKDQPNAFKCRFCNLEMAKNSFNKHMNRHLATDEDLTCHICSKKLADTTTLGIHLTTHTGDKPFKCDFEGCEQSFINKNLLQRHSRFHGVAIPIYNCPVCNKEVASKYHLKSHMKVHDEGVECQLCKRRFERREELQAHYQNDHEPFSCSICSKTFAVPRYLKMHENTHNNDNNKPFKCEICTGRGFTKLSLLMNHMLKAHPDIFDEWKLNNEDLFKTTTIIL